MNKVDFTIWVTNRCNLKCAYCYEGDKKKNSIMNDDVIEYAIKFIERIISAEKYDYINIHFHGGEPFLAFDVMKKLTSGIKSLCDGNDINFDTTTNGTIINNDIIKFINDNKIKVSLSIDGSRKTHDKYRKFANGEGTYDLVLNNWLQVLEKKQEKRVRMTCIPDTVETLAEDVSNLINLGFNAVIPAIDYGNKDWNETNMKVLYENLLNLKNKYKEQIEKDEIDIGYIYNNCLDKVSYCGGGVNSFQIDADGSIYPCVYTVYNNEEKIGDVFRGIDKNKICKLNSIYREINEECDGCGFINYCVATRCKFINNELGFGYSKPHGTVCAMSNVIYKVNKDVMD